MWRISYMWRILDFLLYLKLAPATCGKNICAWSDMTFAIEWFVYLGFYVAFNTVQVISRRVVGRAEETST